MMKQVDRIKKMEQHLDRASRAVMQLSAALDDYSEAQEAIRELETYYGNDEWKQDFADDEAGRLPKRLKRGVLSEDGIWNLLEDSKALNQRLRQMVAQLAIILLLFFVPTQAAYPTPAPPLQGRGMVSSQERGEDFIKEADAGSLTAQEQRDKDFVKGADVGFLTGQEQRGQKFYDVKGQERDCLELLKNDYQMSAIRMRVWVNPRGGSCDKNELLAMARRVKALGMDLMVDFHYSDWWADPAKQPIPKAWLGHSFEEMKQDLRAHTIEVLSLLKENDIEPRWVQVGNETANGMLWSVKTDERGWEIKDSLGRTTITHSMGHIKTEPQQYAGFIRAGYDAVKEVFPNAIVIIHLDRGHRQDLYDWNLDIVLKYGGKFDMVGMSLYPYWAREGHPELKADDIITDCIKNIRHVSQKYGCDVMIVETGYEVDEQHPEVMEEGRRQLSRVIREARNETDGHCRGVFYWEPQCLPGGYKLGAFNSKGMPTVIMDGFVEDMNFTK